MIIENKEDLIRELVQRNCDIYQDLDKHISRSLNYIKEELDSRETKTSVEVIEV